MKNKAISESSLAWLPKSIWGPLLWRQLHCRALSYLPMKGEQEWFNAFIQSIPCPHCQKHFQLFVEQNPPDFKDRPSFFRWTVLAHNYVNKAKDKKEVDLATALGYYVAMFDEDDTV